jgi:hypothetical protein
MGSRAAQSFVTRMEAHLRKHFPNHCATLGDAGVREAIGSGTAKAGQYGIESERDVCKFITLMFTFGRDFDVDPKLPWASEILRNPVYQTPTHRTEALYATAKTRTRQASRRGY